MVNGTRAKPKPVNLFYRLGLRVRSELASWRAKAAVGIGGRPGGDGPVSGDVFWSFFLASWLSIQHVQAKTLQKAQLPQWQERDVTDQHTPQSALTRAGCPRNTNGRDDAAMEG
jgi:hypothetical protein